MREKRKGQSLLKDNLVIGARAFSKMHLRARLWHCAFSSQTQNATFSKKLRFIPNQMGFLYLLSSKRAFWVGKAETNKHQAKASCYLVFVVKYFCSLTTCCFFFSPRYLNRLMSMSNGQASPMQL